jgi:hypothetical protein
MVFRLSCALLIAVVFLIGCRDKLKTKEKVQQAVIERLEAHSGLDLKALDVTTTDVNFEKNTATATVAFHPRGDTSINSGMTMKYTLEERDGKWVVTGVNNAHGGALSLHPPMTPGTDGSGAAQLPPGHPSVSEPSKQ